MDDQQAIERYRYMLKTAPPDDVERAHAEAFGRLTPDQRRMVLNELAGQVPPSEVPSSDDPESLARLATRAEIRQPGTMERTFSRMPAGPGFGGMFFATLAGAFVGTAIADSFFGNDAAPADASSADQGDASAEADADAGYDDAGGFGEGDLGGGDFGGDFGGI